MKKHRFLLLILFFMAFEVGHSFVQAFPVSSAFKVTSGVTLGLGALTSGLLYKIYRQECLEQNTSQSVSGYLHFINQEFFQAHDLTLARKLLPQIISKKELVRAALVGEKKEKIKNIAVRRCIIAFEIAALCTFCLGSYDYFITNQMLRDTQSREVTLIKTLTDKTKRLCELEALLNKKNKEIEQLQDSIVGLHKFQAIEREQLLGRQRELSGEADALHEQLELQKLAFNQEQLALLHQMFERTDALEAQLKLEQEKFDTVLAAKTVAFEHQLDASLQEKNKAQELLRSTKAASAVQRAFRAKKADKKIKLLGDALQEQHKQHQAAQQLADEQLQQTQTDAQVQAQVMQQKIDEQIEAKKKALEKQQQVQAAHNALQEQAKEAAAIAQELEKQLQQEQQNKKAAEQQVQQAAVQAQELVEKIKQEQQSKKAAEDAYQAAIHQAQQEQAQARAQAEQLEQQRVEQEREKNKALAQVQAAQQREQEERNRAEVQAKKDQAALEAERKARENKEAELAQKAHDLQKEHEARHQVEQEKQKVEEEKKQVEREKQQVSARLENVLRTLETMTAAASSTARDAREGLLSPPRNDTEGQRVVPSDLVPLSGQVESTHTAGSDTVRTVTQVVHMQGPVVHLPRQEKVSSFGCFGGSSKKR